jgi:hypothetical protein
MDFPAAGTERSAWKRQAENSSKGTKVGWKSFMPEK